MNEYIAAAAGIFGTLLACYGAVEVACTAQWLSDRMQRRLLEGVVFLALGLIVLSLVGITPR